MCEICANTILRNPVLQVIYNGLKADALEMRDGIWKGDISPSDLHLKSVRKFHDRMFKEMKDELDWGDFGSLKPDSTRYKRLASLELNSFVFSSLKNYEFLNTVKGIRNRKGMTKAEFDREFEAAHNMVYNLHSDVEINHARSVATSIRNWENVERYGDTMPYLTYQTAGDERVRPAHAALDNITKRFDDSFWDIYYPPNGYRCRCQAIQDFEGEITELPEEKKSKLPAPDKSFDLNWGKSNGAWRKSHTYMDQDFALHPEVNDRIASLLPSQLKSYYKVNEKLMAHPLIGEELEKNIAAAVKYDSKKLIKLNPEVKLKHYKNVDTFENGKAVEFKIQSGLSFKKFLKNSLNEAIRQRATVIILVPRILDLFILKGKAIQFFEANPLSKLIVLFESEKIVLESETFLKTLEKMINTKGS